MELLEKQAVKLKAFIVFFIAAVAMICNTSLPVHYKVYEITNYQPEITDIQQKAIDGEALTEDELNFLEKEGMKKADSMIKEFENNPLAYMKKHNVNLDKKSLSNKTILTSFVLWGILIFLLTFINLLTNIYERIAFVIGAFIITLLTWDLIAFFYVMLFCLTIAKGITMFKKKRNQHRIIG